MPCFEWGRERGAGSGRIKINFNTNYWFWWLSLYGLKGRIDELNFTTRMRCNGGKTNKPSNPSFCYRNLRFVPCSGPFDRCGMTEKREERRERALQRPVHQAKSRQSSEQKAFRNKMLHVINSRGELIVFASFLEWLSAAVEADSAAVSFIVRRIEEASRLT